MEAIELEQAGPILGRLLAQGTPQMAVLPIHARDLPRLLSGAAGAASPGEQPAAVLQSRLDRRLSEVHPSQRAQVLLTSVIEQAAGVLVLDQAHTLDPRRPLREYGLDSLMALDLAAALGRVVGRKLPPTLVYEHPTAEALAVYLARLLGLEASGPPQPAADERMAAIAEVQQLSEKELDAIVAESLDSLSRHTAR
jgi:acyl carrier protein